LQRQAYIYDVDQRNILQKYTQLFSGEYNGGSYLQSSMKKEGDMPKAIEVMKEAFG
jgi:hypothetical protein